jgi:hypothetical protein
MLADTSLQTFVLLPKPTPNNRFEKSNHMRCVVPGLFLLLLLYQQLAGQEPIDTARKPLKTKAGQPIGTPVKLKIGKRGGSISSADSKLTLVFPEGALEKETQISIQPINNTLTLQDAGAYQLEPSGIRFNKPVTIIFKYEGDAELKGIAMQEESGQWWSLRKATIDTVAKTITGAIPHFSRWALFERLHLRPKHASLRINKSLSLVVIEYSQDEELLKDLPKSNPADAQSLAPMSQSQGVSADGDYLPPLPKPSEDELPPLPVNYKVVSWTVNSITDGNSEVGRISNKQKKACTYTAPGDEPSQNPVAVTAKLEGLSYTPTGGRKMRTLFLTSNIRIIGNGYRFTYIHKNFAGCFDTIDSSSCMIQPRNNTVVLSNIINYKAWSDWDPCTNCNYEWLNKETFKANVEINGMSSATVTPATETDPFTKYFIKLTPAFGNTPSQRVSCPKSPSYTVPSVPVAAQPAYIHFESDGTDIIIHYFGVTARNVLSKKTNGEEVIIRIVKLEE